MDKLTITGDKRGWERGEPREVDERRFWKWTNRIPDANGCWIWSGPLSDDGYGRLSSRELGRRLRAHAYSYYLKHGRLPLPCGCHKCDVPLCVNPDHIFAATIGENIKDMWRKGRQGDLRVFGGINAKSKLTRDKVRKILLRYKKGDGLSLLGREYGVTPQCIYAIVRGKNWKVVFDELRAAGSIRVLVIDGKSVTRAGSAVLIAT